MNIAPRWTPFAAKQRVLGIQAKLHRWAGDDLLAGLMMCSIWCVTRRSSLVAWDRVRGNKVPARPGWTAKRLLRRAGPGVEAFLTGARAVQGPHVPAKPVRERMIPKAAGSYVASGSRPWPTGWCRQR